MDGAIASANVKPIVGLDEMPSPYELEAADKALKWFWAASTVISKFRNFAQSKELVVFFKMHSGSFAMDSKSDLDEIGWVCLTSIFCNVLVH